MILNRITNALMNRNLATLIAEILIIIVGIFLGLQVDDWNNSRNDRIRETRYLERLYAELGEDIQNIDRSLKSQKSRRDMGRFLLDAIDNPELVRSDPSMFIRSLLQASFTFPPTISDSTFEELKFNGDMAIIQDDSFRARLSGYYGRIERYFQYQVGLQHQSQGSYSNARLGILNPEHLWQMMAIGPNSRIDLDFSEEEAWSAYERMLARPTFIAEIPRGSNHGREIRTYASWAESATILRDTIGDLLALPVDRD
jgi:hypothetical protein